MERFWTLDYPSQDTWEPKESLVDCEQAWEDFHREEEARRNSKKESKKRKSSSPVREPLPFSLTLPKRWTSRRASQRPDSVTEVFNKDLSPSKSQTQCLVTSELQTAAEDAERQAIKDEIMELELEANESCFQSTTDLTGNRASLSPRLLTPLEDEESNRGGSAVNLSPPIPEPMEDDVSKNDDSGANLKSEIIKLQKELNETKKNHERELAEANDKFNELQRHHKNVVSKFQAVFAEQQQFIIEEAKLKAKELEYLDKAEEIRAQRWKTKADGMCKSLATFETIISKASKEF